jgi:hypothetical protein
MIKHIFLTSLLGTVLLGISGCGDDPINHPNQNNITKYVMIDYYEGLQSASYGCFLDVLWKKDRGFCPMYYENRSKFDEMWVYYEIYENELKEFQISKIRDHIENANHYERLINEQLVKNEEEK